jgi:hypothetical protein
LSAAHPRLAARRGRSASDQHVEWHANKRPIDPSHPAALPWALCHSSCAMPNRQLLKYIERVTAGHDGPAWIAHVEMSASGKTLYFNNRAFKSWHGQGIGGNYYDIETEETYWITTPKKSGNDRHRFGKGVVFVHSSVLQEYLEYLGTTELDEKRFQIISNVKPTNKERFHKLENQLVTGKKRIQKDIRTKSDEFRC